MHTYRRAVLIYNPAAGRKKAKRAIAVQQALSVLGPQAGNVEAWPTAGPHSATALAQEACQSGADLVLVCGGDGTVNEVINGMAHTSVRLGLLPAGTANVLALEVGLPLDPVQATAMLPQLEPRRIALGRVCAEGPPPLSRYFLLMAGTGMDAGIVYNLNLRFKSYLGVLAYWLAGLSALGRRPELFQVEVNGRSYECTFALATHSRTYGGNLRIARGAHLLAAHLELVLFHARSSRRYLRYLAAVGAGTLHRLPDVTFLEARHLELRAAPESRVHMEVDGEYAGCLPASIEIVPDALTLLIPTGYILPHG